MENEALNHPSPRAAASLPRAVWIGGAALCLAVAALAGALVTKSVDAPRVTVASSANLPSTGTANNAAPTGPSFPARQDEVPPPPNGAVPAPVATPAPAGQPVPLMREGGYAAAPAPAASPLPAQAPGVPKPAPAPCLNCGTVESVQAVRINGQGTGVGAVAGGVLGGVVGNQFGHGNGRAAMTVLGAVGGGFAGNEVERRTRAETRFDVRVRMRDGSRRVLREAQAPAVGTRVVVEGNRLRVLRG